MISRARPGIEATRGRANVVLSLFSGIGLLDDAFRRERWCVVSAGDLQFGQDVGEFWGERGMCEGIIAGPPCQTWSVANRQRQPYDQIDFGQTSEHAGVLVLRQLLRVIDEVRPDWWLVENVPGVPDLRLDGYTVQRIALMDSECGGLQRRLRNIQFGSASGRVIRPRRVTPAATLAPAVLAGRLGDESHFTRACRLQGLDHPPDLSALTQSARFRAIGNGVPLTMGRVLARAVRDASPPRCVGPNTPGDCVCGCGRDAVDGGTHGSAACRKRMQRRRDEPLPVIEFDARRHGEVGIRMSHAATIEPSVDAAGN